MNEPLAALVAAAKALDRAYGAIPAGGLSPLTPERAQAWADLQDALAAIPPDAVLVTGEALVRALHETHATCLHPVELCDLNRPIHRQFHDDWAAAILAALRAHP